jgi:hypothetical protein
MATTIKSTALDFDNIKEALKDYFKSTDEFADYDFAASGLNNLMDVLAYNTHLNGLIANFTLNESFLGTAQLRSSLVSLATGIGYIPDTKTASRAIIRVRANLSAVTSRPSVISLPKYTRFTATLDDVSYTFQTIENYDAEDNGSGIYYFKTDTGSEEIPIYEGSVRTKTFLVGEYSENDVYIIPDVNLDADTVEVNVYESPSASEFTAYQNIIDTVSVNENSTLYILKESPNGFYQLSFGANDILGRAPRAGNAIQVKYLSTKGAVADGITSFTPQDTIVVDGSNRSLLISTISPSAGGDEKETIESIRRNAPFQYATQNRMVTPEDYTSIILRNFSTLIKDIKSWGGEDNPKPKFGTVFSSILFKDDVSTAQIQSVKNQIADLVDQLAIVSFNVEFADPVETFVETSVFFQVNPRLTPLSLNTIKTEVRSVVSNYFDNTIGNFDQSFRRSNLLTLVDDVSPAVLSSRADVKIQQRITPVLNSRNTFTLTFPADLRAPDDELPVITSSTFIVNNTAAIIRNKLSSTILQVVAVGTNEIVVDNIGSYDPIAKSVQIVSLKPSGISGAANYIKISAVPANQSFITPTLNDILKYDAEASSVQPVITTAIS